MEAPRLVGQAQPERLEIRGVSAGTVVLDLVQVRPWEEGTAPVDARRIEITVTPPPTARA